MAVSLDNQELLTQSDQHSPWFDRWQYNAQDPRDLRLDFLRGLFVVMMFIDHVQGRSFLHWLAGGSPFIFLSEAAGFVALSGLLCGKVYHTFIDRHGFRAAALKAWRRAGTLYLVTIALFVGLVYLRALVGVSLETPEAVTNPLLFFVQVFGFQYSSFELINVLMVLTLLIASAPIGLWLLQRGKTWLLFGLSLGLWLAYQVLHILALPAPEPIAPLAGLETVSPVLSALLLTHLVDFHPLAWQLFFVPAMIVGYHYERIMPRLGQLLHTPIALGACVLTLAATVAAYSYTSMQQPLWFDALFLKNNVGAGTVLVVAATVPLLSWVVTYLWQPLKQALGWLLIPMGQHSLYAYIVHVPIIYASILVLRFDETTLVSMTVNTVVEVAIILGIWMLIRWRFFFSLVPR